jgi:hypothetical protein
MTSGLPNQKQGMKKIEQRRRDAEVFNQEMRCLILFKEGVACRRLQLRKKKIPKPLCVSAPLRGNISLLSPNKGDATLFPA